MRTLLLLLSLSALSAMADDGPSAVVPENLERLDPLVVDLIRTKVADVEARRADAGAHGDLGLAYEANQLWSEARAAFENAVRLAPGERLWRFHLALAHRELGDFEAALTQLRTLSESHPRSAPVEQRLGEALLESGELADAKAAFERLVELEPGAPHGYVGLGDVLLRQGRAEEAVRALEKAVELAPGYRAARYLLGTAYLRLRRLDEAERELTRGADAVLDYLPDPLTPRVRVYQRNLTARLDRAGSHLAAGEPGRAAEILETVYAAHPENVTVLNNLAIAYMRQNRLEESHALLERALALEPEKFSTYLNLTFWGLRARRFDKALEYADGAVSRAPEMAQPHFTRAQALAELGRFDEALASLARSLELDPRHPSAETFSGDLCLELRRFEAARTHYENAVAVASGFLPAWLGLARANAALGETEAALAALAQARRVAPGHPMITRLEQELGKNE